jgi:hypothetical protein
MGFSAVFMPDKTHTHTHTHDFIYGTGGLAYQACVGRDDQPWVPVGPAQASFPEGWSDHITTHLRHIPHTSAPICVTPGRGKPSLPANVPRKEIFLLFHSEVFPTCRQSLFQASPSTGRHSP